MSITHPATVAELNAHGKDHLDFCTGVVMAARIEAGELITAEAIAHAGAVFALTTVLTATTKGTSAGAAVDAIGDAFGIMLAQLPSDRQRAELIARFGRACNHGGRAQEEAQAGASSPDSPSGRA